MKTNLDMYIGNDLDLKSTLLNSVKVLFTTMWSQCHCFGSGFARLDPDPYSESGSVFRIRIRIQNPDPYSESRSGSWKWNWAL